MFLIDDLRNGGDENKAHGVNEVRLRQGRIVREGLRTTLSELRLRKDSTSSRKRWLSICGRPSLFIVGRERAKLGYFWRHAYRVPHSGPYVGCVVNSDTGKPVIVDDSRLTGRRVREGQNCRNHRNQRREVLPPSAQPALAGGRGQDPPHGPD